VRFGLRLATHGIVMESGRVLLSGKADDVLNNPEMAALYFGGSVRDSRSGAPLPPSVRPAAQPAHG
jgi:branched-chain amino acid transport system ATP-binding protein